MSLPSRVLPCAFAITAALAADPKPSVPPPDGRLSLPAPVNYRDQMLVVVTEKGVAAFKFGEAINDPRGQGVEYRYRYLPAGSERETGGESAAFEKRQTRPNGAPGNLVGDRWLKAGDVKIEWSLRGPDQCYVYYRPEEAAVLVLEATRFDDRGDDGSGDKVLDWERVDLRRFRRLPRPAAGSRPGGTP